LPAGEVVEQLQDETRPFDAEHPAGESSLHTSYTQTAHTHTHTKHTYTAYIHSTHNIHTAYTQHTHTAQTAYMHSIGKIDFRNCSRFSTIEQRMGEQLELNITVSGGTENCFVTSECGSGRPEAFESRQDANTSPTLFRQLSTTVARHLTRREDEQHTRCTYTAHTQHIHSIHTQHTQRTYSTCTAYIHSIHTAHTA